MKEEMFEKVNAIEMGSFSKTAALSVMGHVLILFLVFWVSSMSVPVRKELSRLPIIQATLVNQEKMSSLPPHSMAAVKNKVKAEERKELIKPQSIPRVAEQKTAAASLSTPSVQAEGKKSDASVMNIDAKSVKTASAVPGKDNPRVTGAGGSKITSAVPRYRSNPHPPYPHQARVRGHEGLVVLTVDVREDGRVSGIKLKRSSGFTSLDQSALATVRSWIFDPARRQGMPIASVVDIPIRFSLHDEFDD